MTLQEAIAEVKPCPFCGSPAYTDKPTWRVFGKRTGHEYAVACSSCEVSGPGDDDPAFALRAWNERAAASGDLIPKADAELAVAAAYELTVKEVECWLDEDEWPETRRGLTMAILALAPADALAEVARLRALVRRVVNDPVWRTNDNTLWPDLCAAIRPAQGDAG